MKLNLQRPLVVFDLEATGLDLVTDRIIQISYIKVHPDGTEERLDKLINPEKHIDEFVANLTGIDDEMVKNCPTFKQVAATLAKDFTGCDFAGYNSNRFDIPLLAEEFLRAGIDFDFSKCRMIDAMTIFSKMERRNLAAAYKFFCGRKMEDDFTAHRANEDTEATYRVLQGELDMYAPGANEDPEKVLENDVNKLHEFSKINNNVDFAGRIIWQEINGKQVEVFNFGKHKGKPVVDVLRFDPGYFSWILAGEFTYNTKQVLTRIRLRESLK